MTTPASHPGLTFAAFRPRDPRGVTPEQLDGWFEAHSRGFHQGRVSDEMRRYFSEHIGPTTSCCAGCGRTGR